MGTQGRVLVLGTDGENLIGVYGVSFCSGWQGTGPKAGELLQAPAGGTLLGVCRDGDFSLWGSRGNPLGGAASKEIGIILRVECVGEHGSREQTWWVMAGKFARGALPSA